jgi:hypothetical protein
MAAAGFLYLVIGFLAIQLALGAGGKAADKTGALQTLADEWWGTFLLVLVALGFAGLRPLALRRRGARRKARRERRRPRAGKRLWYLARGLFYAFLCYETVKLLAGSHTGSGNEREQTATVLDWPAGRWLVAALGFVLIGWGIGSAYRGITREFKDDLHTERMSMRAQKWTTRVGVVGCLARAVVYALIGVFLVRAAILYDPDEAIGLDGALQKLAQQTFGPLLLSVVAAGIIAYGVLYFVRAAYREV